MPAKGWRKPDKRARKKQLNIRITPEEQELIKRAAEIDLLIGALRRAEHAALRGEVAQAAAEANYGLLPYAQRNLDRLAGINPEKLP